MNQAICPHPLAAVATTHYPLRAVVVSCFDSGVGATVVYTTTTPESSLSPLFPTAAAGQQQQQQQQQPSPPTATKPRSPRPHPRQSGKYVSISSDGR